MPAGDRVLDLNQQPPGCHSSRPLRIWPRACVCRGHVLSIWGHLCSEWVCRELEVPRRGLLLPFIIPSLQAVSKQRVAGGVRRRRASERDRSISSSPRNHQIHDVRGRDRRRSEDHEAGMNPVPLLLSQLFQRVDIRQTLSRSVSPLICPLRNPQTELSAC